MSEKTEQPTDKKRADEREKGNVPLSRDLARLATLLVLGELAFTTEKIWHGSIDTLFSSAISRIGQPFPVVFGDMVMAAGTLFLSTFAAMAICGIAVAIAAFWGQIGVLVSFSSLSLKFDQLNPVNGITHLFSKKKLVELLASLAKAVLIGYVLYLVVLEQLPTILKLSGGTPRDVYYGFVELLNALFNFAILVCLSFAFVDLITQRYFYTKSLMMSLDEIKREHKESEGDPMFKGTRRQLAQQWASEAPASRTEEANAVVVNPTHFAVALKYDEDSEPVPLVIAKGKDAVAQAMIARAHALRIPVIRHVWLARTLYATAKADSPIPKSSDEAVAHVFAVIQEMNERGDVIPYTELETRGEEPEN